MSEVAFNSLARVAELPLDFIKLIIRFIASVATSENRSSDLVGGVGVFAVEMVSHGIEASAGPTAGELRDNEIAVTTLENPLWVEFGPNLLCDSRNDGVGCQIANLNLILATSELAELLVGRVIKTAVDVARLAATKSSNNLGEVLAVPELLGIQAKLTTERRRTVAKVLLTFCFLSHLVLHLRVPAWHNASIPWDEVSPQGRKATEVPYNKVKLSARVRTENYQPNFLSCMCKNFLFPNTEPSC